MLRLETLRIIDPSECNMDWQKFLHHGNMAYVAQNYFKTDVLLSNFIWSRHSSSILPDLDLTSFRKWLIAIPNSVEPFQIIQWLKHFVPCFLQAYPQEMNLLVQWTVDRVRMLQFSNCWPEIGLEFGNKILNIFGDIKFMFV